jgi:nitrite reductase/ring-hydroxylating ferredoxin subunit
MPCAFRPMSVRAVWPLGFSGPFPRLFSNVALITLNITSLALRRSGHTCAGRRVSLAALALLAGSAHLGGHLAFGLGVGVNRTAWNTGDDAFHSVAEVKTLAPGELRHVEVAGRPVLVSRRSDGAICAIDATCSHLGGPLHEGERRDGAVVCPWHGSVFDLCSGDVIRGPAVFPQPRYETRERDGMLEVRQIPFGKGTTTA